MDIATSFEQLSALSIRSFTSFQEALDAVLDAMEKLLGMRTSFLSNISREDDCLTIVGTHSSEGGIALDPGTQIPLPQAFCSLLAGPPEKLPLVISDVENDPVASIHPAVQRFPEIKSYIGIQVTLANGALFGTLCAIDSEVRTLSPEHSAILFVLARMLATQIEREQELVERHRIEANLRQAHEKLKEAYEALQALAATDSITGLPNHSAVLSALEGTIVKAQGRNENCAVCFVDLDHFKAVNDTYGHAAGDSVLKEMGRLIRRYVRFNDFFGRWGGEEFVIVLDAISEDDALLVADRIRSAVSEYVFPIGGGIHLTASFGVAAAPVHATNHTELINMADKAMYSAKRLGRNQVCSASHPLVEICALEKLSDLSREASSLSGMVDALTDLLDARDQYTGEHTQDVYTLASQLGERMELEEEEVRMLGYAARLHDIGKIAIPDAVLNKPGKLDAQEWQVMQTHAQLGADIVSRIPALRSLAPIIHAHHERWDGAGYPQQLVQEEIPLGARIIAVADSYGAMTTNRPYRQASSPEWALAELQRCAGSQFDPRVVDAFAQLLTQSGVAYSTRVA